MDASNTAQVQKEIKMKTAKEVFNLAIISIENGIALVGDGSERFEVNEAALNKDIACNDDADSIRLAYDKWCGENA